MTSCKETLFYKVFLKLKKVVEEMLVNICKDGEVNEVCFTGHSLGGAVATLCFAHFIEIPFGKQLAIRGIKIILGTVGSPRVGDELFAETLLRKQRFFEERGTIKVYRVVNNEDYVPTLPSRSSGYHHFGRPVNFEFESSDSTDANIFVDSNLGEDNFDEQDDLRLLTKNGIENRDALSKQETSSVIHKDYDFSGLYESLKFHLPETYYNCQQNAKVSAKKSNKMDR